MARDIDFAFERQKLLDAGYQDCSLNDGISLFRKENADCSILLFLQADLANALWLLGQNASTSVFLPRVMGKHAAGEVALVLTEPLLTTSDLPDLMQKTRTGHADAYSHFPLGDCMHESVHAYFGQCSQAEALANTTNRLADVIEHSVESTGPLVLNAHRSSILFRDQGHNVFHPVYANPFRLAISGEEAASEAKKIRERCARLLSPDLRIVIKRVQPAQPALRP